MFCNFCVNVHDFVIPTSCWAEKIDISIDFLRYKIVKHRPFPGQTIHNFKKIGSRNQYRSIEHKKYFNSDKLSASKSIRTTKKCPKNLPKNPSTSTDLASVHTIPGHSRRKSIEIDSSVTSFKLKYWNLI